VAPGDPDPQVSAASIERGVTSRAEPGSVVVLHVNGRGIGTTRALPGVVAGLRARGFRLAKASEVLATCAGVPGASAAADAVVPAGVPGASESSPRETAGPAAKDAGPAVAPSPAATARGPSPVRTGAP